MNPVLAQFIENLELLEQELVNAVFVVGEQCGVVADSLDHLAHLDV